MLPYSGKVWRALNLMQFKFGDLNLIAIIYTGEFLIWQSLPNSLNHQIKFSAIQYIDNE